MVPRAGLEPARPKAKDFKSFVSTIPPPRHTSIVEYLWKNQVFIGPIYREYFILFYKSRENQNYTLT